MNDNILIVTVILITVWYLICGLGFSVICRKYLSKRMTTGFDQVLDVIGWPIGLFVYALVNKE